MDPPIHDLWGMDDLDLLASDLDSSLSGLGGTNSTTFDMSDALSAIQVIKMNKENEVCDREHWLNHLSFTETISRPLSKERAHSAQDLSSWNFSPPVPSSSNASSARTTTKVIKKPCRKHQDDALSEDNQTSKESGHSDQGVIETSTMPKFLHAPTLSGSVSQYSFQPGFTMKEPSQTDFQYILAAATALGTKVGEDTLTYLNQGQPYEIRLKKLHGLSEMKGKLLKSTLCVGFQERRLQFREKLEIIAWQNQRPSERILDIDLSLSYGIFDVIPDPKNINSCEFMWDPTREASVFLKVNCISTEFTSKRRGGEKGVPFRIQIETYSHWENPARKLDAASCLVKVFKSKGADRKHKTDKEKIEKLPQVEQRDLQPSYQCTVFSPIPITVENIPFQDFSENFSTPSYAGSFDSKPESPSVSITEVSTSTPSIASSPQQVTDAKETLEGIYPPGSSDGSALVSGVQAEDVYFTETLHSNDIHSWLVRKKFSKYLPCFSLYSARDLLCLSREDLIEICGPADGIRLYNCLHLREPPPLRKLYISRDKMAFHALYLHTLTCFELMEELYKTYQLSGGSIGNMYVTGPDGILLIITDKVLQNLKDESTFTCDILKAEENEKLTIILRTYKLKQDL